MATLINGDGNPAVYAVQDADWYIGLLGGQTRILNRGLKFAYHVEDINTFLMDDGLILTKEGRRIQLDANAQDEITIPNGVQGSTQYYIVGYHLYTDASANQLCEVFIQQMDNATDTIEEKTFISGETEVYISLYRITQTELVVSNVQLLLPIDTTQAEDRASLALSLSDLRSSFMGADTALSNRITANTNNIANIRGIISTVEEGDTATAAYSSGDFVQYTTGGTTYFANVVSSIAIGDTFVNGTNVENTTIADNVGGIDRTPLTPPTATTTSYDYDGTAKSIAFGPYDTAHIEIQGVSTATELGIYRCSAVLKDSYNYCWSDGTNDPKEFVWSIMMVNQLQLSKNSLSGYQGFFSSLMIEAATITRKSTGAITAIATTGTVSINGDSIKWTPDESGASYSGTITVSDAGDSLNRPSTAIITLTNVSVLKKVTFANGTDAEVAAVVAAMDDGTITAEQTGWTVGDERSVPLAAMSSPYVDERQNAQTVTLAIMDTNHYDLTTATSGGDTKCHFVVGLKNCLQNVGFMNASATNSGSWGASRRRSWCNTAFKNAFPSDLLPIFKQFKVITAKTYNGTTNETTDDYFALFAEKEVFNEKQYSNQTEADALTRVKYYETAANARKIKGNGSTYNEWYLRSPYASPGTSGQGFCIVSFYGGPAQVDANTNGGIAPFGVI